MGNSGLVPENYGFKVVEVIKKSPGEKAGLVVEADFILTVNGKKLRKLTPEQIKDLVQANEEKELKLKVFNSTTGQIRDVSIIPSKKWPGQGLLGVRIRLEPYGELNVEVSIADSEFSYDDIYASEKDNTVGNISNGGSYGFKQNLSPEPTSPKKNSFIDSLSDPLSVFRATKR